jgi:protocatechuate 3,4-dioxygenase, beta subunit
MHNESLFREPPIAREQSKSKTPRPTAAPQSSLVIPYHRYPRGSQPPYLYPPYRLTLSRAPRKPLILLPHTLSEVTGPVFGHDDVRETDNDLTRQHAGEPLGERITVSGRVLDDTGRPVPHTLIEIWQCNAAGRYRHRIDQHDAPLDPNFSGGGRTLTDAQGTYRFITIKPGPYPWENHPNAWRPAHVHFSLYGTAFATRLVTQMYFPGDPLFPFDPIFNSVRDERARQRMISRFEMNRTEPGWALAFRFDIVVRGREATPFERKK